MQNRHKCFLLFLLGTLLGAPASWAQSLPPRIFFSDLESGPNTGGQNGKGAFVTIYGRNFGATRGTSTATVGGGAVDNCPLWTDTKVACQLGPAAQTGNIVISVGGQASNGVPFTVRPGNIYFVSPVGSDTNPGTFAAPFKTPAKGQNALTPCDTLYLMDGINTSAIDDFSAVLNLRSSGAPGLPKAIVAYPGASVTLGSDATPQRAILAPDVVGKPWTDWVIAGLTLRANDAALEMVGAQRWRVVGNDISCPNGHGASACAHGDTALFVKFLGNNVHDAGTNQVGGIAEQKLYHSVYFSTDSNHVEVGWDTIVPNGRRCPALQFHSQRHCGARVNSDSGGMTTRTNRAIAVAMNNNIFFLLPGEAYFTGSSKTANVTGPNNLFFGAGAGPTFLTGNVNADPLFLDPLRFIFRLSATSPAIAAGIRTGILFDFDGLPRPQLGYSIGAFEFQK